MCVWLGRERKRGEGGGRGKREKCQLVITVMKKIKQGKNLRQLGKAS